MKYFVGDTYIGWTKMLFFAGFLKAHIRDFDKMTQF
tara:strand:- start:333 stop:440 length:108 start_codon:yes stop_codon:yes gene_type:complete